MAPDAVAAVISEELLQPLGVLVSLYALVTTAVTTRTRTGVTLSVHHPDTDTQAAQSAILSHTMVHSLLIILKM